MSHTARRTTVLGLLIAAGFACGCDQQTPTGRAVQIGAAGIQTPTPEGAGGQAGVSYSDVVQQVQPVASSGLPGENAAAATLVSRAQKGLSNEAWGTMLEREREGFRAIALARASLEAYVALNAQAAALATYNPSALIAELEQSASRRGEEARAAQAELTAESARESELRSRVASLREQASREADEAGRLRMQANALTASQATPVVKQSAEAKRRADALAKEAALVEAQADQITPRVTEARLRLEQYQNQQKDMLSTVSDLKARAASAAQEAEQARREAQAAGQDLARRATEITAARAETLAPAGEAAARQVADAVSTAKRAGNEGGVAGKLALGTSQHQLADIHLVRAQGLRAYADLMDELAKVQPALPDAGAYASQAQSARATLKELLDQAGELYRGAQSAYAGVQAKADVRDKLQAIADSVEKLAEVTQGESLDVLGQYLLPAAPAAEGEVPRALVNAINRAFRQQAAGQFDQILENVIADDATKQVLRSQLEMTAAFARLEKSVKEKTGSSLLEAMAPQLTAMGMSPRALTGELTAEDFDITMTDARTASASPKGGGAAVPPALYRLADGRWQLDLTPMASTLQMTAPMLGGMTSALNALADDVDAGKFTTVPEVVAALQQRLLEAMQGGAAPASPSGG